MGKISTRTDLTENMDFSRTFHSSGISLSKAISEQDDLFPTGSVEEIRFCNQYLRLYHSADGDQFCDCCGKLTKDIPWKEQIFLCETCYKNLDDNFGAEYPWRFSKRYTSQRDFFP